MSAHNFGARATPAGFARPRGVEGRRSLAGRAWRIAQRDFVGGHGRGPRGGCRAGSHGFGPQPSSKPAVFCRQPLLLIQLRLLANMFDGMVAIETGKASPTGALYNEVPDRVSDAAMFIGAGYGLGGQPPLGYLAACLAVFLAYLRAQGRVAGAPQEFCGPMAKPQRAFVMTLLSLYCAVAPAAWQAELMVSEWGAVAWVLMLVIVGELWTAGRRLRRIARHLRELPS